MDLVPREWFWRRPRILPGEFCCLALARRWVEWSSGLGLALVVLRGFGVYA